MAPLLPECPLYTGLPAQKNRGKTEPKPPFSAVTARQLSWIGAAIGVRPSPSQEKRKERPALLWIPELVFRGELDNNTECVVRAGYADGDSHQRLLCTGFFPLSSSCTDDSVIKSSQPSLCSILIKYAKCRVEERMETLSLPTFD
ncbi:hypothetical protein STEG23_004239 [Scotinomys teguina]